MTRPKTQAGKVDIVVQSDRLRLRWSWIKAIGGDGRRFVLPLAACRRDPPRSSGSAWERTLGGSASGYLEAEPLGLRHQAEPGSELSRRGARLQSVRKWNRD